MRLRLKLDYPQPWPENATAEQITLGLLRHAVTQKYPQGLPKLEVRLWARIEEEAASGADAIEISLDQSRFLAEALSATSWPVAWARSAVVLLDSLQQIA
jgi:hypothetical protein